MLHNMTSPSSWTLEMAHLACFLYCVKQDNLLTNEGVFYGRNISEQDKNSCMGVERSTSGAALS